MGTTGWEKVGDGEMEEPGARRREGGGDVGKFEFEAQASRRRERAGARTVG